MKGVPVRTALPGEVSLKEYAMAVADKMGVSYKRALHGLRYGGKRWPKPELRRVNARLIFVRIDCTTF